MADFTIQPEKNLQKHFDEILPEAVKINMPLTYNAFMIFLDYIQDTYDIGKTPDKLIEILTAEEQDWENIDEELLRREFIKVYLYTLNNVVDESSTNFEINKKLTSILDTYGIGFENQDLKDVIDFEKILASKNFSHTKGLFKSYYYIFDILKELNIVKTLSTFNDYYLDISEEDKQGNMTPFQYNITTSISSIVFEKMIKKLVHPIGFEALYSALLRLVMNDNYSYNLTYKSFLFNLTCKYSYGVRSQDFANVRKDDSGNFMFTETTKLHNGVYVVVLDIWLEDEKVTFQDNLGNDIVYPIDRIVKAKDGIIYLYYMGETVKELSDNCALSYTYEQNFENLFSEDNDDTKYDIHFDQTSYQEFYTNFDSFNIGEFEIGDPEIYDTVFVKYRDTNNYFQRWTKEDIIVNTEDDSDIFNPFINGTMDERFTTLNSDSYYESTIQKRRRTSAAIMIGRENLRNMVVLKEKPKDVLTDETIMQQVVTNDTLYDWKVADKGIMVVGGMRLFKDQTNMYFGDGAFKEKVMTIDENTESDVEEHYPQTEEANFHIQALPVENEIYPELVTDIDQSFLDNQYDFYNDVLFDYDRGNYNIGEFLIGDTDIEDTIIAKYVDDNMYNIGEVTYGSFYDPELYDIHYRDWAYESTKIRRDKGINDVMIGESYRDLIITKTDLTRAVDDEGTGRVAIVASDGTWIIGDMQKTIGVLSLVVDTLMPYMNEEWRADLFMSDYFGDGETGMIVDGEFKYLDYTILDHPNEDWEVQERDVWQYTIAPFEEVFNDGTNVDDEVFNGTTHSTYDTLQPVYNENLFIPVELEECKYEMYNMFNDDWIVTEEYNIKVNEDIQEFVWDELNKFTDDAADTYQILTDLELGTSELVKIHKTFDTFIFPFVEDMSTTTEKGENWTINEVTLIGEENINENTDIGNYTELHSAAF